MADTDRTAGLAAVRALLDAVRADGRAALTAPEGRIVADAYGIAVPGEALAKDVDEAVAHAARLGGPVVLKIVSPDILHKTDAGGVVVGVEGAAEVRAAFCRIIENARAYDAGARIDGVQVQQLLPPGQEVIVGAVTDPTFGKVVAFGLGGVLVEVLKDITFRLAPVTADEGLSMLDSIGAAEILRGVRGAPAVDRWALAEQIRRPGRRCRGGGGVRVPLRARSRRLPVHDGEAGRGARREVPVGPRGRVAGRRPMT